MTRKSLARAIAIKIDCCNVAQLRYTNMRKRLHMKFLTILAYVLVVAAFGEHYILKALAFLTQQALGL